MVVRKGLERLDFRSLEHAVNQSISYIHSPEDQQVANRVSKHTVKASNVKQESSQITTRLCALLVLCQHDQKQVCHLQAEGHMCEQANQQATAQLQSMQHEEQDLNRQVAALKGQVKTLQQAHQQLSQQKKSVSEELGLLVKQIPELAEVSARSVG